MNRSQLLILLVALTCTREEVSGGLLPGDNGYQYDRPTFAGDFGRRTNVIGSGDNFGRFPGRPSTDYGAPVQGNFANFVKQPGGFGFPGQGYQNAQGYSGYPGYQGPQGYNLNYQGYQGVNNQDYQGFQGDGPNGFRAFDDGSRNAPMPYSFQYEVRDAASGNDYGQQESGDARGVVRGEYRVLLPDSRTQIVRYTADDANGYVADVRYEGQAQFPRSFNTNGAFFNGGVGGFQGPAGRGDFPGYNNQYLPPNGK